MKKKILSMFALLLIGALLFSACGSPETTADVSTGSGSGSVDESSEESSGEESTEVKATCALITPNPLGDRSFIDSSARGIEKANEELPVDCVIIETNGVAEHESALRGAIAEDYDLILGLAMDSEMFMSLAEEFPEKDFVSVSEIWAEELPENMASFVVDVHDASFLAGLVVGSMTDTKIVGVVNGGFSPAMNQFTYGFEQGVHEVCSDCEVLVSYLGFDFSNPTLGMESALSQYEEGADIIYQVAGRTGEGVLEAAAQVGKYAIGVDSNQDYIQPGSIITSVIKRVDLIAFYAIKSYVEGTFEGGFHQFGMKEGFAGISWDEGSMAFEENGPADMVAKIPAAKELVEEYREKIVSGEYVVCNALVHSETPMEECERYEPSTE